MSLFDKKGPKTLKGLGRKLLTGDGRVDPLKKIQDEFGYSEKPKKRRK